MARRCEAPHHDRPCVFFVARNYERCSPYDLPLMEISVVTPSFNMLPYLRRCRASVADQQGVSVEHIVADGGSTDGTVDQLAKWADVTTGATSTNTFRYFSGKDAGMYDALNKGFAQTTGDVVAWLNCDEQYLEGTLAYARDRFRDDPELDILFGSALLVKPDGSLLAARKSYPARYAYIATMNLYNLSCGMFFRRKLWDEGLKFDMSYRQLGDQDLILRALRSGARTKHTSRPLSVFSFTGNNLSWSDAAMREVDRIRSEQPMYMRVLRRPINLLRMASKAWHGAYRHGPVDYAVYPEDDLSARRRFKVDNVSASWPDER
ncbi:MAG: glycosyltransferase [Flavobacteriales bacterium]|nr:glycosyltransferase [Flavobacteriales bacterium]